MMAAKVFVTSATSMVTALTQIDDKQIHEGEVGFCPALKADYIEYIQAGE